MRSQCSILESFGVSQLPSGALSPFSHASPPRTPPLSPSKKSREIFGRKVTPPYASASPIAAFEQGLGLPALPTELPFPNLRSVKDPLRACTQADRALKALAQIALDLNSLNDAEDDALIEEIEKLGLFSAHESKHEPSSMSYHPSPSPTRTAGFMSPPRTSERHNHLKGQGGRRLSGADLFAKGEGLRTMAKAFRGAGRRVELG